MPEKYSEKRYLEQIFNFLHLASRSDVAYLDPVATGDIKQAIYEGVWDVLGHDRNLREAITLRFTAMRPRKQRGPLSAATMRSFRAQLDYGGEAVAKERKVSKLQAFMNRSDDLIPIKTGVQHVYDPYAPPDTYFLLELYGEKQLQKALERYSKERLLETVKVEHIPDIEKKFSREEIIQRILVYRLKHPKKG